MGSAPNWDPNPLDNTEPALSAVAITPSDSAIFTHITRWVYVGSGGDMTVTMGDKAANQVLLKAVPVGSFLRIGITQILDTGTAGGAGDYTVFW